MNHQDDKIETALMAAENNSADGTKVDGHNFATRFDIPS